MRSIVAGMIGYGEVRLIPAAQLSGHVRHELAMQLVNRIRFGPFSTSYHRDFVDTTFKEQLELFLRDKLLPQLDSPLQELDGTLTAAFGNERNCGPNSLVRDIFTLECVAICDDGVSDLKADVVYNPRSGTFAARTGFDRYFYVWTPARKRTRENELAAIQRVVDDIMRGDPSGFACPICGGRITAINNPDIFDARCSRQHCFVYNFHKDDRGRLAHGHFFTKHPMKRAEQGDGCEPE